MQRVYIDPVSAVCKIRLGYCLLSCYVAYFCFYLSDWWQAVPLAQKTFRVEADSLHLTLVGRFIYDVMHFVSEAKEIASVLSAPPTAAAPESQPQQSNNSYRPITEVKDWLQHV